MRSLMLSAIAVALACAVLCVCSATAVSEAVNDMLRLSERLSQAVEENAAVREPLVEALCAKWNQALPTLEMICDHDHLHIVTERLAEASLHSRLDHRAELLLNLAILQADLNRIRDFERFSAENIL